MKLTQLEAFLAVHDHSSFSEAALELSMSQAAISYAIAELEKELGTRLLERGRFGAKTTEIGHSIAVHARAMLQHQAAIAQQAAASQGRITGVLRVASFRSAAGKLMPPLMAKLQKHYPDLSIQLIELDYEDAQGRSKEQLLKERLADIAFTENPRAQDQHEELIFWEVMRDHYKAVVSGKDKRTELSWKELNKTEFIFSTCIYCSGTIEAHLQDLGISFKAGHFFREDSTILRMVSQGLGISILPELAIDELPENAKVLPMREPLERIIAVAVLPGMLKTPAVRLFLTELKKQFPDSGLPNFDLPKPLESVA